MTDRTQPTDQQEELRDLDVPEREAEEVTGGGKRKHHGNGGPELMWDLQSNPKG
jgi:hypothetical protein